MVELGALLGAMIMTLASAIVLFSDGRDYDPFGLMLTVIFFVAPVVGALWGAGIAAAIHFAPAALQFAGALIVAFFTGHLRVH